MSRGILTGALATVAVLWLAPTAFANHPVLVEGNCNADSDPAFSPVPAPGTCGDYDGDGQIGTAENGDGDRVFGTINAANTGPGGIANNGTITVVSSGRFAEQVTLSGNVTLEGAPGVEANIDAFIPGDPASTARQNQPGIIVDAPDIRLVTLRNLQSRNWTSGIQVRGRSNVAIEGVRVEHNTNYGIEVGDSAEVSISNSEALGTGRRVSPATGDFPGTNPPNPGIGISFEGTSAGSVFDTRATSNLGGGIAEVPDRNRVCIAQVNLFDNNPDVINFTRDDITRTSCVGTFRTR